MSAFDCKHAVGLRNAPSSGRKLAAYRRASSVMQQWDLQRTATGDHRSQLELDGSIHVALIILCDGQVVQSAGTVGILDKCIVSYR